MTRVRAAYAILASTSRDLLGESEHLAVCLVGKGSPDGYTTLVAKFGVINPVSR